MSKDNKSIYNFGQHLLDLNKYIYNLGTNVLGYLNSKKDWNLGQKEEFINSYNLYIAGLKDLLSNNTNRFRTDDFGTIYDSQNILSSKDNDIDGLEYYYNNKGERIKTSDYNQLKDRKKKQYNSFSSNREVASYFNLIGKKLAEVTQKPAETSNKFDLSKNGFQNRWLLDNNPAGGTLDLTPYLELEKVDEATGKRGTSERSKYLALQLLSYADNLPEYDFSDTVFKTREEYLNRLKGAIEGLNSDGYNSQDTIALTRAGLSSDFLRDYFSDGTKQKTEEKLEDPNKAKIEEYKAQGYTDEEILKLLANEELLAAYQRLQTVKQSDAEVQEAKKLEWLDSIRNRPFNSRVNFYLPSPAYNTKWYEDNIKAYNYDPNRWLKMELLYNYFLNPDLPRLRGGKPLNTKQQLANHLDWATRISGILLGYLTSSGSYIIPSTIDYNTMSAIQYNPNTRLVLEISLIGTGNADIESLINDYYNKNIASNKLGGTIEVMQYGGDFSQFNNYVNNLKNTEEEKATQLKKEAEESGKTPELIKAGLRKPSEGFTAVDYARMGSAALDVASLLSAYIPGYGTAISGIAGLGSTTANFFADMADDSVSWKDMLGNAATGVGLDILGLIPGAGTAGKVGKIAKTLKFVLPKAMLAWGAYANGGEAIKASEKLLKGEDLTVGDWQALSAGLQLLVGGARLHAGKVARNRYLNRGVTPVKYKTIRGKSGTVYRVTPEHFDKITKGATLEDLNKAFKEAIGNVNDELGSKFKVGAKEKVKGAFTNEPEVGEGVYYETKNIDWSKQERIPWGYGEKDGKIVPKVLSDDWILSRISKWGFGDPTLFTKKNPLYGKLLLKPLPKLKPKLTTSKKLTDLLIQNLRNMDKTKPLTLKDISRINNQRRILGLSELTTNEIEQLNIRRQNNALALSPSFKERLSLYKQKKQKGWTVEDALLEQLKAMTRTLTNQKRVEAATRVLNEQALKAVLKALDLYGVPQYKKPLQGAAYNSALKKYDEIFDKPEFYIPRVVTIPRPFRLNLPTYKKPLSGVARQLRLKFYENFDWGLPIEKPVSVKSASMKSEKGVRRLLKKEQQRLQEEEKKRINAQPYISSSKNKNKRSKSKPKKTSKDTNIKRRKLGGTLNMSRVRKFLKAGSITLNNGIVDWSKTNQETPLLLWSGSALYSNHPLSLYVVPNYTLSGESGVSNVSKGLNYTFSTLDRLLSVLNRIKNNSMTIDDANIMLKRHWGMYQSWNPSSSPVENSEVKNYLKTYQDFGLNDEIIAPNYKQNYIINSQNPNSNDAPGKWSMDGLYSLITDDRRVLARKSDYDNNPELLKKDIELAKSLGYEYYLDPDTLYYMLKPLSVDLGTLEEIGPSLNKVADEQFTNKNSIGFKDALLSKLSPTLKYGLPRALYADSMNRRMTDLAIDNEKAYLKDPFSFNRYLRSNLDAEVLGLKNYAAIRNRVSLPISSDGRLLTLANLASEVEGQKAIDAGKLFSNQTAEKYAELALLQQKENARDAHDTALFNRMSNLLTQSNKNKYELAYLNKKHTIWDTFWLLLEFDAKTKEAETKALRDNFALSDIELAVNNDLGTYAPNLSPEALDIWNQVLTGKILPHQLSNEQMFNYRLAMKEAAIAKLNLLRQYYNIPSTLWGRIRSISIPYSPTISIAKKGTKIETADKNLERFYKSIFKLLDISEKLLERLSKSIYALYKK